MSEKTKNPRIVISIPYVIAGFCAGLLLWLAYLLNGTEVAYQTVSAPIESHAEETLSISELREKINKEYPSSTFINSSNISGDWLLFDSETTLEYGSIFTLKVGPLHWDPVTGPNDKDHIYRLYSLGRVDTNETAHIIAEINNPTP
ncbi:hypothetical protein OAB00_00590 [Akkermansiaceae bacterium]|nr:hypothetical protein [Akkermansiaceae bacterium]